MKPLTVLERRDLKDLMKALNQQTKIDNKDNARNFGDHAKNSVIPYMSYLKHRTVLQKFLHIRLGMFTYIFDDKVTAEQARDVNFVKDHLNLALTHGQLMKRIENVLLTDVVKQGTKMSDQRALLLKMEDALIDQEKKDQALPHMKMTAKGVLSCKRNFWPMFELNNGYDYITVLDNHPELKKALHVITAENMVRKPFLKGCIYDMYTHNPLTHHEFFTRVLSYEDNLKF